MPKFHVTAVMNVQYFLALNSIYGRMEDVSKAGGPFNTREEAIAFYNSEKVEAYTEDRYRKSFRKGGPLEFYNPVTEQDLHVIPNQWGHGIHEITEYTDVVKGHQIS